MHNTNPAVIPDIVDKWSPDCGKLQAKTMSEIID
jgi:hypothetical protein